MIETAPLCGCGAGFCRSYAVAVGGPDFGRKFYACPIKKGQGACSFFLWQDVDMNAASPGLMSGERVLSPVSTLTDFILVRKGQHYDLGQCNTSCLNSDEHVLLSPLSSAYVINRSTDHSDEAQKSHSGHGNASESQGSNNQLPRAAPLKRNNLRLGELREIEGNIDEPLTRQSKRLREADFEIDISLLGSSSMSKDIVPMDNSINSLNSARSELVEDAITSLTVTAYDDFLSSCLSCSPLMIDFEIFQHSCWMLVNRGETLRNHVQGWWGRLAFPPMKCLTEPVKKPCFCCIFPSFDPIFVPPNVYQLKEAADPSANLVSRQCKIGMKKFVSNALVKAALQLQADLLGILRPLDVKDHEIMTQEANTTFDALDRLGTDHSKFREQVKEFIQNASILAKIDQSISSNRSYEKLVDRLNRKKLKLTEMKDAQARLTGALSVSTQRATRLTEEISRLKDKLCQSEAEISRCSSEKAALKVQLSQVSKDRVKTEHSLKKTHDRLKGALRLRKVMEVEIDSAKAAFDKAKMLLWGS